MSLDDPSFVEQFLHNGVPLELDIKFEDDARAIPFECTVAVENGTSYLIIKLKVEGGLSAKLELKPEHMVEQVQEYIPQVIPMLMRRDQNKIRSYLRL